MEKWLLLVVLSACVGLGVGSQIPVGSTPCPTLVADCPLGHFGKAGGPAWICCADGTHVKCVDWSKQKGICNYTDPGQPVTYGYTLISSVDTVNLNCDILNSGSCY